MTTITLRSVKGSPLTNTEVDNNFTNLNTDKAEISSSTGSVETPAGTTAQRDGSPSAGFFRYNTTTGEFEGYSDDWNPLGITYTTSIPASTTTLRLTGSNAAVDDIAFAATGLIGVTRTDASTLTFSTTANNYSHPNHTGEVTSSGDGATTIAANVVDADNLKVTGNGTTTQFLRSDADGTFTWAVPVDTIYTHPNHSGEVTSTADGATVIASDVVDAANLKVTGNGTTSQWLRSDGDGTFSWVAPPNDNTVYTHPTHNGDDISIDTTALTGATIISDLDFNVTTDGLGHVTDANGTVATRELTLADLGYTGTTNANTYSHPNHSGEVTSSGDGATTIASNVVDNDNLKDSVTLIIKDSAGTALKTLYGAGS